ncbi:MAG: right-handed parallel beta-helix repeat-containing protein [Coriobacteriia bacterium]|nr:right-handed parallel beta-helix repeat-containing protein [Coriobacteriia bacterium]
MRRARSRWLSLVATAALVVSMMPVTPASAAIVAGSGAGAVPAKAAGVATHATPDGIQVRARGFASDAQLDFFRSESKDGEGVKLNDAPIKGNTFLDSTAKVGIQYYYAVKVAVLAAPASLRFAAVGTGYEPARVMKAANAPHTAAASLGAQTQGPQPPTNSGSAEKPLPAALARDLAATTFSTISTITANTTWTKAKSPYYVDADLIVKKGVTLTIEPGVKVYFGTGLSGRDAPAVNPSMGVDLIVHGKLIADGTADKNILFSSVGVAAEKAGGFVPNDGDWGYLYFDSMAASVMDRTDVEYGMGLWLEDTSRPYVTYSTIHDMGWGGIYVGDGAVDATTPRARFVGNRIDVSSSQDGIYLYSGNTGAGNITLDPYISGNTIRAGYPIALEVEDTGGGTGGNHTVLGNLRQNTLQSNYGEAFWLESYTRRGKSAKVLTTLTSNRIVSQEDDGIYAWAENYDYGPAICSPEVSGSHIMASDYAVYMGAQSDESTDSVLGNVTVSPTFDKIAMTGQWEDAVYLYADTQNKGRATIAPSFSNGPIESAEYDCVSIDANSRLGEAIATPSFRNVNATSADGGYVVDCQANGPNGAKANPSWIGGYFDSGDSIGIYAYAESDQKSAEAKPYLLNTSGHSYNECVEVYAYGSNDGLSAVGNAVASPTIINSRIESFRDHSVYAWADANGFGYAKSAPVIQKTTIINDEEDTEGVYAGADSNEGGAYASPTVTNSSIRSGGVALYCDADRNSESESEPLERVALVAPVVSDSKLSSPYYDVMYLSADNNEFGDALVKPVVTDSTLYNGYDDYSVYMGANKSEDTSGTSGIYPSFKNCSIRANDDPLYMTASGPGGSGAARVGGSFTDCSFQSPTAGIYASADNDKTEFTGAGSSSVTTKFNDCTVDAPDDYGYDLNAYGGGDGTKVVRSAPTIKGGRVKYSGDGVYVYAAADVSEGETSATVIAAPVITDSSVAAAWNYGIYANAYTNGMGTAKTDATIHNTPVYAYYGIYLYANSSNGDAVESSDISGHSSADYMRVQSFDGDAVFASSYSAQGDATSTTRAKYLFASGYYGMVDVRSDAPNGTATNDAYIAYNVGDAKWGMYDDGISSVATGERVVSTPEIRGNTVKKPYYDGIAVWADASSAESTVQPVVANNTIDKSLWGYGLDIGSAYSDSSNGLSLTGNKITDTYYGGIYASNFPYGYVQRNHISGSGLSNPSADVDDIAGVYWFGSKAAHIEKNDISSTRVGVAIAGATGNPSVRWNNFGGPLGGEDFSWVRPHNLSFDVAGSTPGVKVDARSNWWSTTNSTRIARTIDVQGGVASTYVNYTSPWSAYTAH